MHGGGYAGGGIREVYAGMHGGEGMHGGNTRGDT